MLVDERFVLPKSRYVDIPSQYPHQFGFGGFGEATYYRTYPREMENGQQEHWMDTCVRTINGLFSIRKDWHKKMGLRWRDEDWYNFAEQMLQYEYQMKFLPPGRGLWALGSEVVYEHGSMALNNCAFTDVGTSTWIEDIGWGMDALMLGCGVGYRLSTVPGSLKKQLRRRDPSDRVCVIGDSREGWVESVEILLKSFIEGRDIRFDYHQIRPYGSPIRRFGGVSSGPAPLIICHRRIEAYIHNFLDGYVSQTRLLADIINAVGQCVVSGNVRRGAQIILGNVSDLDFINLKSVVIHGNGNIPTAEKIRLIHESVFDLTKLKEDAYNYGAALEYLEKNELPDNAYTTERLYVGGLSNNSVALGQSDDFLSLPVIADGIRANGEPGFLNLININKFGRFGDKIGTTSLREDFATGCNPCGEIPLESKELCNLSEVFPTRCADTKEFLIAMKMATFYSQTVSLLQTHRPETNEVISRNRRIGVSVTGAADWLDQIGAARMTRALRDAYRLVVDHAAQYAQMAGVPAPIRHTTVKPSGTISQLAGVSSGMHFPTFLYAIRRIRVAAGSPMDDILRKAGYPHESDSITPNTIVFEFPINQGKTRKATDVSMWEQVAFKAMLEREWADNMVSCTAYFKPETEAKQIEHLLGQFAPLVKSMSMLPHTEKGAYEQMPYEEISEDVYLDRMAKVTPIDWNTYQGIPDNAQAVLYCENDHCTISR